MAAALLFALMYIATIAASVTVTIVVARAIARRLTEAKAEEAQRWADTEQPVAYQDDLGGAPSEVDNWQPPCGQ